MVAIYCVWDYEHLRKSVDNIKKCVDQVIIVWSKYSNYGNKIEFDTSKFNDCLLLNHEPGNKTPHQNEMEKRNAGLQYAKKLGFEYFIMMDADEFYHPEDVKASLQYLQSSKLNGLVCKSIVYFVRPDLSVEDTTYVTFIHKITNNLKFIQTSNYPFTKHKGILRIDPTRRLNITSGVQLIDVYMHHYSWVRQDYHTKINNSSARNNLQKSSVLKDIEQASEGYFCQFYGKQLQKTPNYFNL